MTTRSRNISFTKLKLPITKKNEASSPINFLLNFDKIAPKLSISPPESANTITSPRKNRNNSSSRNSIISPRHTRTNSITFTKTPVINAPVINSPVIESPVINAPVINKSPRSTLSNSISSPRNISPSNASSSNASSTFSNVDSIVSPRASRNNSITLQISNPRRRSATEAPKPINIPKPKFRRNSYTDIEVTLSEREFKNKDIPSLMRISNIMCHNFSNKFINRNRPSSILSEHLFNSDHSEFPLLPMPYTLTLNKFTHGALGYYEEIRPGIALRETRIITGLGIFWNHLYIRVNPVVYLDNYLAYFTSHSTKIVYIESLDDWFIISGTRWIPGVKFFLTIKPVLRTYIHNSNVTEVDGRLQTLSKN